MDYLPIKFRERIRQQSDNPTIAEALLMLAIFILACVRWD